MVIKTVIEVSNLRELKEAVEQAILIYGFEAEVDSDVDIYQDSSEVGKITTE